MKSKKLEYFNVKKELYIIYENGDIYSNFKRDFLKSCKDKNGYLKINLQTDQNPKRISIATLVAYNFIGYPPKEIIDPTIDHIDKDKNNNHCSNLRWMERSENARRDKTIDFKGSGNPFFGKTHSEETKLIIKKKNTGRKDSPEVNSKKGHIGASNPAACSIVVKYENGIIKYYGTIKDFIKESGCSNASAYSLGKLGVPKHYWLQGKCFIYRMSKEEINNAKT